MNTISKEQLTAYALDELSETERKEIEALLAASEEDQQYAAETKNFCALLQSTVGAKEAGGLTESQKQAIVKTLPFAATAPKKRWPVYLFGASAAAAVAVMLSKPYFDKQTSAAGTAVVSSKDTEILDVAALEKTIQAQEKKVEEKRVAMLELQKKYDIVDLSGVHGVFNGMTGTVDNGSDVTYKQARARVAEFEKEVGKLQSKVASIPSPVDKRMVEMQVELATRSIDNLKRSNADDQASLVTDKAKQSEYLMAKREYEQQSALHEEMKEYLGKQIPGGAPGPATVAKNERSKAVDRYMGEPAQVQLGLDSIAAPPTPSLSVAQNDVTKTSQLSPANGPALPGAVAKAPASSLGAQPVPPPPAIVGKPSTGAVSDFALPNGTGSLASASQGGMAGSGKGGNLGDGMGKGFGAGHGVGFARTDQASASTAAAAAAPAPTKNLSLLTKAKEAPESRAELYFRTPTDAAGRPIAGGAESRPTIQLADQIQPDERPAAPSNEAYLAPVENPFKTVAAEPLSTFSIDVDTASYANVRRFLNMGQRPPADAVRLEELVNYFRYDYPKPEEGKPCSITADLVNCPWNETHRLARIGLKAKVDDKRPQANLVFLLDVSGSMNEANKLPLVKQSLKLLVEKLNEADKVSIVVYAGASGLVLPPTSGENKRAILGAIDNLQPGGSTNGASGITLAYEEARKGFIKEGVNRVILATDGDFNVGVSDRDGLQKLIEKEAKSGVFLSVLGYGMGNLKDSTMEVLADKGNGNYAYIDSVGEARKVLAEEMSSTLVTVAKDVKLQIEFNPSKVRSYKLLGYENRMLAKEDFNDDKKDAGEMGAGHTVTALYEIVPSDAPLDVPAVDDLKYQRTPVVAATPAAQPANDSPETMTVKLRYKAPDADTSKLMELPVTDKHLAMAAAPGDFKFATAVAGYALLLKDSKTAGNLNWEAVRKLAREGKGEDAEGYRGEFLQLIEKAAGVDP